MVAKKEVAPGQVVLEIDGNLSGNVAQEFQRLLEETAAQDCKSLTLDMTRTTAINSASIGRILLARKKLKEAHGVIQIKGCNEVIYESLTALNLDKLISIEK